MTGVRGVASGIRFLCELGALAGLAHWGFDAGDGGWAWVLGLGVPIVAAAIWGAFVAPKARWPVRTSTRLAIEVLVFGGATAALVVAGEPVLGAVLAVAALLTSPINAVPVRER